MDKNEITAWGLANGWEVMGGHPSLIKPGSPKKEAIVRLVCLATVVNLEVKKPAGKWEKVGGAPYAKVIADPEGGPPDGLNFAAVPSISRLMQDNRDARVFAKMR
jgi:hypothetical protein